MKYIITLILLLALHTCVSAINITDSILSGGVYRKFILHAPGLAVASNLPVVYVLHGDGGTGAGIRSYSGFDSVANQNNFIAVYPNAHQAGGLWNKYVDFASGDGGTGNASAVDDVQFFSDLTTYLCATYSINSTKVFATGHSGGAFMCYNLALQLPSKIAGIAPIAGSCWGSNTDLNTLFTSASYVKVPVYHIHGDADATVSYPDPDHTPVAWAEWPFSSFAYYGCSNSTYGSTTNVPGTTTVGSVKKLTFCSGPSGSGKEILLIRMVSGGHGWPTAGGYKPAQAIWNFFNQYSLSTATSCNTTPPAAINGVVIGGIASSNNAGYIHTAGKYILGPQGDTVVLRGVNYAPYNWGWDSTELRINQIALTNANAVRLVWYVNGGGAPHYSNWRLLDSAISKCVQNGMVVIPELHDQTCTQDSAALTALITWWTHPNMIAILNKYQGNIIVNFANEALGSGAWGWLGGSPNAYKNIYGNIITQLRSNYGFNYPIMLDAPECGGNELALLNNTVATHLNNLDPLHNIIFSVHTYWPTPSNTAAVLGARLAGLYNSSVPFVLGEVAATSDCSDVILLDSILRYAKQYDLGWLAWSWDRDNCAARQISTNGLFASLTPTGAMVVNNLQVGLNATAVKILPALNLPLQATPLILAANSNVLTWHGTSQASYTSIERSKDGQVYEMYKSNLPHQGALRVGTADCDHFFRARQNPQSGYSNTVVITCSTPTITIAPNPATGQVYITGLIGSNIVRVLNVHGATMLEMLDAGNNEPIDVSTLPTGLYFAHIQNGKQKVVLKLAIK
jgi:poly(3-hydroxybutyrate) depolymerase